MMRSMGKFQSSPALSSGRYLAVFERTLTSYVFQSSPALSRGRYYDAVAGGLMLRDVSILARSFERALLTWRDWLPRLSWFQSSPALSSGRYAPTPPRCRRD